MWSHPAPIPLPAPGKRRRQERSSIYGARHVCTAISQSIPLQCREANERQGLALLGSHDTPRSINCDKLFIEYYSLYQKALRLRARMPLAAVRCRCQRMSTVPFQTVRFRRDDLNRPQPAPMTQSILFRYACFQLYGQHSNGPIRSRPRSTVISRRWHGDCSRHCPGQTALSLLLQ